MKKITLSSIIFLLLPILAACGASVAADETQAQERIVITADIAAIDGEIVHIAAGIGASFALLSTGELWSWGDALRVLPETAPWVAEKVDIPGDVIYVATFGNERNLNSHYSNPHGFLHGDLHYVHAMAITSDNELWGWGFNGHGQLGNGRQEINMRLTPTMVMSAISSVSVGDTITSAIDNDGMLWTWGQNFGSSMGVSVSLLEVTGHAQSIMNNARQVSVASGHTLVINDDGELWGWGNNGALGIGWTSTGIPHLMRCSRGTLIHSNGRVVRHPYPEKIMDNVVSIAAGFNFSLALTEDGHLYAMGSNGDGRAGSGTLDGEPYPAWIPYPIRIMENVAYIAASLRHAAAITNDGHLYTWGANAIGQLGNGTTESQYIPQRIKSDVLMIAVSGGSSNTHMLAVTACGSLWGWGCNRLGQLGVDPAELVYSAVPILIRPGV